MSAFHDHLKVGDRVRLIKPFRYVDDDEFDDEDYDAGLREFTPHGADVLGTVMKVDWELDPNGQNGSKRQEILVKYDTTPEGERAAVNQLWTNPDVLGPELDPPSEDEVQAAINSILGAP